MKWTETVVTRHRASFYIDDAADRWLRYLAEKQGRSMNDLLDEALRDYLERQGHSLADPPRVAPPSNAIPHEEWAYEFQLVLDHFRAGIPDDIDFDELEAEIDEAVKEVRAERWRQQVASTDD